MKQPNELKDENVLHRTDSIAAFQFLTILGSRRDQELANLAKEVWLLCLSHDVRLSCQYVGANVLINNTTEIISPERDHSNCTLNPRIFNRYVWRAYRPYYIDLFVGDHAYVAGRKL